MSTRFSTTARTLACAALVGLSAASAAAFAADSVSPAIAAAVAEPTRPEADRARDADRKPAEVIAFAGIKPGDKVAEVMPGGGYFTRIFSKVVGDNGVVFAMVPARPPNAPADAPDFAARVKAIASSPGYGNIQIVDMEGAKFGPADVAWTSLNYHDFHNRPNADLVAFNKRIYDSLKPGGTYIVIDHSAAAGSGKRDTGTLHRIDPELVKSEAVAAGFQYVGESAVLRNPADPKDKGVRDVPRGKSDQFVLKFRRP
jgi:predicted methyltransferase